MSKVKLFCFPHAGGSAMVYQGWKKYLNQSIELHPVEMAGRGRRFGEKPYKTIEQAVEGLYTYVDKYLNDTKEYAMFGHSMGSIIAYEVAHKIKKLKGREPVHMFFSGRFPPHIVKDDELVHKLDDEAFIEKVLEMGGTQKEVFENKELLSIFMPVLRADYEAIETYSHVPKDECLDCNISILGGKLDKEVTIEDLNQWSKYTRKQCKVYEFDGGHFFINQETQDVVNIINDTLIQK